MSQTVKVCPKCRSEEIRVKDGKGRYRYFCSICQFKEQLAFLEKARRRNRDG